jgi:hypothetical protein
VLISTAVAALVLLGLPRQSAALPLLVGASDMTLGPSLDMGPFHFTAIRMSVAVGFLQVLMRSERMRGAWSTYREKASIRRDRQCPLFGNYSDPLSLPRVIRFNWLCWDASDQGVRWNISGNHRAGGDNGVVANSYFRED